MNAPRQCAQCGTEGAGNFCQQCGASLAMQEAGCPGCGAAIGERALYCTECGAAVGAPEAKPRSARIPWLASAFALVAFSILIAWLVQGGSVDRVGEMTMTGGLPGETASGGGMPSMEELASMTARQAADRLFERAMREHEGADFERAAFFIDMGLQAYDAVPESEVDADMRFHVGLLRLLMADSTGAREAAEAILAVEPDHLLGLLLASRAADFAGGADVAEGFRGRVRATVEEAGGIPARPEYESHRALIESALAGEGEGDGGS